MCRRSSRRCIVMLSAPDCSAIRAANTGSGKLARRAWRSVATWSTLTPRCSMGRIVQKSGWSPTYSALLTPPAQGQHHLASAEFFAFEAAVERGTEQSARLGADGGIGEILAGNGEQHSSGEDIDALRDTLDARRALVEPIAIGIALVERAVRIDVTLERKSVAECIQQPLLEQAQRPHSFCIDLESLQRHAVHGEDVRMAVMTREQLQQQLVQVEAAHEAVRRQRRDGPIELRRNQLARLASAAPGHQQPIERLQDRSQRGARLARAARP